MITIGEIPLIIFVLLTITFKIAETIFMIEIYNNYTKIKKRMKKRKWQKTT